MTYSKYTFGYQYHSDRTIFTVFATDVNCVNLVIYQNAHSFGRKDYPMTQCQPNIWQIELSGDLKGTYYAYSISRGKHKLITPDPYAFACGINGKRSYVADLKALKASLGELSDFKAVDRRRAIIYETHIRDFSVKLNDKAIAKGKYLGVIQGEGDNDRLSYLKKLGITHLHLLPLQDMASIDESDDSAYNWGYDPDNYFIPEGSYASDPYDPESRILDVLKMVDGIHRKGLGVILDVVYNHTYHLVEHAFEILAPSAYYRKMPDGSFSNGSGCGNELKTESDIVKKMIIDSLMHWYHYYGFDGFRFDLMGLIDTQTMAEISQTFKCENANIVFYGEPWTASVTTLSHSNQMLKGRQQGTCIAMFNDEYRNALKGDSDGAKLGYLHGELKHLNRIRLGLLGSIDYNTEHIGFTRSPFESINYVSAHDNLILYDKFIKTGVKDSDMLTMHKLTFAIVLLSFGVPFIQAGTEFMQSKQMDHNSYISGDDVNGIDWSLRNKHTELVDWVRSLIEFRQAMPCYQTYKQAEIIKNVVVLQHDRYVGMQIYQMDKKNGYTLLLFNGSNDTITPKISISRSAKVRLKSINRLIDLRKTLTLSPKEVVVLGQKRSFLNENE